MIDYPTLVVTGYSKHNSVEKVLQALRDAPEQKCNTSEAFAGKVFEMCYNGQGPVGVLDEYFTYHNVEGALIVTRDGSVIVERQADGKWLAVSTDK